MIKINEILELSLFNNFKILCGEEYLTNVVNATVICEYESSRIEYEGYCYGYFVLLSYFFADTNPELVNGTIRTLIEKHVSGIAIKISPEQSLPKDIIESAMEYHVPLLIFYEEFMEDLIICINESMKTRAQYIVAESKLNSIINDKHSPEAIANTALEINPHFLQYAAVASITSKDTADNLKIHTYFDNLMFRQYRNTDIHNYSFVKLGHSLMLICTYSDENLPASASALKTQIQEILMDAGFVPNAFHIGISDTILPLNNLNASAIRARNTNVVCQYALRDTMFYSELGIYRYVMSIVTNPILFREVEESIHALQQYDEGHESNLLDTLTIFVKNNGDYTKTSEELFQHANTVRYRIKKAEQILNFPDNSSNEELFMLIRSYLLHNVMLRNY